MTTAADYTGRAVDVAAFQGVTATGVAALAPYLTAAGEGGRVCAGVQKLAQRWAVCFLTEQGSVAYAADEGTAFLTAARQGTLRSEGDVRRAFGLAARQVARLLTADEADADPADERLDRAELLAVTLAPGSATLTVRVSSRAGTDRRVILPLVLTP